MGMLEAVVNLFPDVRVGYIGLHRDEETAIARQYMNKLPRLTGCVSLCLDPMLATGGSAAQAVSLMKEAGADDIRMVTVLVAPEGVARFEAQHPEVSIVTAAYDRQLDERKFILPGLGDFGDRLYGTF
jgi:uracil phosphoribosyltransferase